MDVHTGGRGKSRVLRGAARSGSGAGMDVGRCICYGCMELAGSPGAEYLIPIPRFSRTLAIHLAYYFSGDFHFIAFLLAFLAQPELNLN